MKRRIAFLSFVPICLCLLLLTRNVFAIIYNFENEKQLDDWQVIGTRALEDAWSIDNGELNWEYPLRTCGGVDINTLKKLRFVNGTIKYKVKWVSGSWFKAGLFYRIKDVNNWYHISPNKFDQSIKLCKMQEGKWKHLAKKPFTPLHGIWYEFKVVVAGNSHQVWVDNKLLLSSNDNTFRIGKIGFGGEFGCGPEHIVFDDIWAPIAGTVHPSDKLAATWGKIKQSLSREY